MSRAPIQSFTLTPNIDVYECHPDSERRFQHWRLWDDRAGYNVVMNAKTKEGALVEAIDYWAKRFKDLEKEHDELQTKVDDFIQAVRPEEKE